MLIGDHIVIPKRINAPWPYDEYVGGKTPYGVYTDMEWLDEGVDGFNLAYALTPGTCTDFVEGVVPVLQRRGLMHSEYQEGAFREKLFGKGRARLQAPHPAAHYRWSAYWRHWCASAPYCGVHVGLGCVMLRSPSAALRINSVTKNLIMAGMICNSSPSRRGGSE